MGVPRPVYGSVLTYTSVHGIVNDWILSFTTVVMLDLGRRKEVFFSFKYGTRSGQ